MSRVASRRPWWRSQEFVWALQTLGLLKRSALKVYEIFRFCYHKGTNTVQSPKRKLRTVYRHDVLWKKKRPKSSSALRKFQCEICCSVVAVVDQLQEQLDEITEVEQDERVSRHDIVKELNIDHQIAKRRMITKRRTTELTYSIVFPCKTWTETWWNRALFLSRWSRVMKNRLHTWMCRRESAEKRGLKSNNVTLCA